MRKHDASIAKHIHPAGGFGAAEWTSREDRLVEKHYGKMTYKALVARYLPNRTVWAVAGRVASLGLRRRRTPTKPVAWTARELVLLRKHYGTTTRRDLRDRYCPRHTVMQIQYKAGQLKLRKRHAPRSRWTTEGSAILKRYYERLPLKEIQQRYLPGYSISAIRYRGKRLGLSGKAPAWTMKEDRLLRRRHGHMTYAELSVRFLPGRTVRAIEERVAVLGLSRGSSAAWSVSERAILERLYADYDAETLIARHLPGRTVGALRTQVRKLGLQKHRVRPWTSPELAAIRRYYQSPSGLEKLVEDIGRPAWAIQRCARKLGLLRNTAVRWTGKEDALLRRLYPRHGGQTTISGRSRASVAAHARKLGLGSGSRPSQGKVAQARWSEAEREILRTHRQVRVRDLLALLPGRTAGAISAARAVFGMKRIIASGDGPGSSWSAAELAILRRNPTLSARALTVLLPGRTVHSVFVARSRAGLARTPSAQGGRAARAGRAAR